MEKKKVQESDTKRYNFYITNDHIKFVDEQLKKWGFKSRAAYINYLIQNEKQRVKGL